MNILAVTSCPSGVANTFMAAESLEMAAKERGWEIKVETQGVLGIDNVISEQDISQADVVILTNNVKIQNEDRFLDMIVVRISVSEAIRNADKVMDDMMSLLAVSI
ncbi:PTS fructose-like transporter subunit IIB [Aeromonas allosaccharophila]|uniref:PTS fructose-like transporter subunit IIB n=1 Tax=Aeromonas allosaccharophila TaxID=656 RepID=UPI0038D0FAD9